jgi:hypothetical protein
MNAALCGTSRGKNATNTSSWFARITTARPGSINRNFRAPLPVTSIRYRPWSSPEKHQPRSLASSVEYFPRFDLPINSLHLGDS